MQVVGPEAGGGVADEGPLQQAQDGGVAAGSGAGGGEGDVEGVQEADRAQDVAFVGGEVGEGAGDQGGEFDVEVGRLRREAGAADLEKAHGGQVEVQRQAVGALGDHTSQRWVDQRLAVGGEAVGEVVVAVLVAEVPDQDLAATARIGCGGAGRRRERGRPARARLPGRSSRVGRAGPGRPTAAGCVR